MTTLPPRVAYEKALRIQRMGGRLSNHSNHTASPPTHITFEENRLKVARRHAPASQGHRLSVELFARYTPFWSDDKGT